MKIENLNEIMTVAQAKDDNRLERLAEDLSDRKIREKLKAQSNLEVKERDEESAKGKRSLNRIYASEE